MSANLEQALRKKGAPLVVDVRSPSEYSGGHIEGSQSMSDGQLKSALAAGQIPQGKRVDAICLSAHRSIPAVRLLRMNGFEVATQLTGGMLAWNRANMPVAKG